VSQLRLDTRPKDAAQVKVPLDEGLERFRVRRPERKSVFDAAAEPQSCICSLPSRSAR